MERLISGWCHTKSVPESYILPSETRPGSTAVPPCDTIPLIDLRGDRVKVIQQIVKASQEYGFFQLINHGISEKMMLDVSKVVKEFFELPGKDKERFCSDDPKQSCRLSTSIDYFHEKVHYWRDNLRHQCHPLEDHIHFWPEKPSLYREVVGKYSVEVRKLSLLLLDLICEGLGLECGYFNANSLSQVQLMSINHYPPCPDPSLTLGLPKHIDVNLFNILLQGEVSGLQVFKDGKWLAIKPLPTAFAITIGYTLQVISNGKLKSVDHRVVTNSKVARTTVGTGIFPFSDSHIEPAKALIHKRHPPLYKTFKFKDFSNTYISDIINGIPPTERYIISSNLE